MPLILLYLIKYTIENIVKITIFYFNIHLKNVIYSCDGKAEFSASLLQSSVSHNPSEIILIYWFDAQETFFLLSSIIL